MKHKVKFGKYKGCCVSEVPTQYLMWAVFELTKAPYYMTCELRERGGIPPHAVRGFEEKFRKASRAAERAEKQRKAHSEPSAWVVGEHSNRLEREFLEAGGDPNSCPFDIQGQQHEQPRIMWDGDHPTIVSHTQWLRSQGEFGLEGEEMEASTERALIECVCDYLVECVCDYLEARASDPWEDSQWPAAYEVLTQVAKEIRECDWEAEISDRYPGVSDEREE